MSAMKNHGRAAEQTAQHLKSRGPSELERSIDNLPGAMKKLTFPEHRSFSEDDLINRQKKLALAKSFCTRLDQACTRIQNLRTTYDQIHHQCSKKKKKNKGVLKVLNHQSTKQKKLQQMLGSRANHSVEPINFEKSQAFKNSSMFLPQNHTEKDHEKSRDKNNDQLAEILGCCFKDFVKKSVIRKDSIEYICNDDVDFFTQKKTSLIAKNLRKVLSDRQKYKIDIDKLLTEEELQKKKELERDVLKLKQNLSTSFKSFMVDFNQKQKEKQQLKKKSTMSLKNDDASQSKKS